MALNRIAGFCPSGAKWLNRIPSLSAVWTGSCPSASVHIYCHKPRPLQEVVTQTQHTGRDFLPPLQVMGSLDFTREDEPTARWSGTLALQDDHLLVQGATMQGPPCPSVQKCLLKDWASPGSSLVSCWENNFSSWFSYRNLSFLEQLWAF